MRDDIDYNSLIDEHFPLIIYVIKRNWPDQIHNEDYIQTGMIAMWRALSHYNPAIGSWSTYAYKAIYRAIRRLQDVEERQAPRGKVVSLDDNDGVTDVGTALKRESLKRQPRIEDTIIMRDIVSRMHDVVGKYGVREHDIELMLLSLDGRSLDDIGSQFGVTRQAINQRIKKVQNAMRREFPEFCTKNP